MFNISGQNVNFVGYRVAQKLAHFFVRLFYIRLNFIKYWQIFKIISLSKSEEHL